MWLRSGAVSAALAALAIPAVCSASEGGGGRGEILIAALCSLPSSWRQRQQAATAAVCSWQHLAVRRSWGLFAAPAAGCPKVQSGSRLAVGTVGSRGLHNRCLPQTGGVSQPSERELRLPCTSGPSSPPQRAPAGRRSPCSVGSPPEEGAALAGVARTAPQREAAAESAPAGSCPRPLAALVEDAEFPRRLLGDGIT